MNYWIYDGVYNGVFNGLVDIELEFIGRLIEVNKGL